jgi:RHS repeat-associated protein
MHVGGLQYLRARWYDPAAGVFVGRDPFEGFPRKPYSLHSYQYAYAAPTMYTDPSGRCVPEWIPGGEPGCTLSAGIGQGRVDVRGTGDYAWDVFEGIGLPGAIIADAVAGTNGTRRILDDGGTGTYLGITFTSVATLGKGARMVGLEAPFFEGMLWGGSIDISVQLLTNQGKIDWTQTYFNTLAGGLGGMLGGGVAAIKGIPLGSRILLNGTGSFGIGGLLSFLQNEATGSCYTIDDILLAAGINGGFGMFGSFLGDGVAARFSGRQDEALRSYLHAKYGWQYLANRARMHQTPSNAFDWSLLSKDKSRFVMNYILGQNQLPIHDPWSIRWLAFANSQGMAVANSGVLVSPPPDEEMSR